MKLFFRTMLITWAVMSLVALLALSLPSVFKPFGARAVPFHALEGCAERAVLQHQSGQPQLHEDGSACANGRLVAVDTAIKTDLAGHSLSADQIQMVRSAEQSGGFVVKFSPEGTDVALRIDSAPRPNVYLATIPSAEPHFLFRHLSTLSPIFIAGVLSLFVAAYVVRPLTGLNTATEKFGGGDLKVRVQAPLATRKDELGDLARTFNGMAGRIESLVVGYKDFLAHASHELGSPLTRLNIALALAQRKAGQDLEQELDRIRQESYRLNSLVHEMLLLARIESGNEVNKEATLFDVRTIIEEAHRDAMFEAEQHQKTVESTVVESFVVRGYPVLLQRAVDNVLRNAVRFARQRIAIEVSLSRVETLRKGLIVIRDDGPGIKAKQEEAIFEPFVTLSGSELTGISGGSGLGLAIARQAVLANGGFISAQSARDGGLVITIELPAES
ncbi:sensor histidine kinase [Terriglobus roseus]|uniref:histidine kinase n=1 Tax=Terriglobus roseus TaxID=392734 RepID=A0A1G7FXT5_9BACT|nr:HAMP domain-containing sensor histidine kinase [Terriglobus roseus]SDE80694.1 two-component system, OmpR family, sensor histidine kinase CpxA [Terriglobus roseus]